MGMLWGVVQSGAIDGDFGSGLTGSVVQVFERSDGGLRRRRLGRRRRTSSRRRGEKRWEGVGSGEAT